MTQEQYEAMERISLIAAVKDAKFLQDLRNKVAQQEEIDLRGEVRNGLQTLSRVGRIRPDVLLLGTTFANGRMGRDSTLITAVHHHSPATKIILLAGELSGTEVAHALQKGARGILSVGTTPEDCLRAIRAVHQGEIWIGRKKLASVLDGLLTQLERAAYVSVKSAEVLSERELEIADAVRLGMTNKEIARKLRISSTTVKTHLENIFHKLHVTRRVQLAILTRSPAAQKDSATRLGFNAA
jgi:DNA-binding NarL/FixJ family response regulator